VGSGGGKRKPFKRRLVCVHNKRGVRGEPKKKRRKRGKKGKKRRGATGLLGTGKAEKE